MLDDQCYGNRARVFQQTIVEKIRIHVPSNRTVENLLLKGKREIWRPIILGWVSVSSKFCVSVLESRIQDFLYSELQEIPIPILMKT